MFIFESKVEKLKDNEPHDYCILTTIYLYLKEMLFGNLWFGWFHPDGQRGEEGRWKHKEWRPPQLMQPPQVRGAHGLGQLDSN